jgi:carbonic anhydrase
MKKLDLPAEFEFFDLNIDDITLSYEHNTIVMEAKFGTLTDEDEINYVAYRLEFHTPSDHMLSEHYFPLEI